MDPSILRILDANLNRAREALRVLEEYARFALDDADLVRSCKQCRHDLASAAAAIPRAAMLENRDVQGDVGTRITVAAESHRADGPAVAVAAAKRAVEALRCLEEYCKVDFPAAAAAFEQLRYRTYGLEQEVVISGPRRARLRGAGLHVLITESVCRGEWMNVAEQAVSGGADVLQLREKTLPDRDLLNRVKRLRELTAGRNVLLLVNDRPDIARLADADGVHVGADDLSVADARLIVGRTRLVGKSTHSVEQARAALAEKPDYLAVGPMFASSTKSEIPVQGPQLLSRVLEIADCPVVAIGGITSQNVGLLDLRASIQIAVCAGIVAAEDVAGAARDLATAVRISNPVSITD